MSIQIENVTSVAAFIALIALSVFLITLTVQITPILRDFRLLIKSAKKTVDECTLRLDELEGVMKKSETLLSLGVEVSEDVQELRENVKEIKEAGWKALIELIAKLLS